MFHKILNFFSSFSSIQLLFSLRHRPFLFSLILIVTWYHIVSYSFWTSLPLPNPFILFIPLLLSLLSFIALYRDHILHLLLLHLLFWILLHHFLLHYLFQLLHFHHHLILLILLLLLHLHLLHYLHLHHHHLLLHLHLSLILLLLLLQFHLLHLHLHQFQLPIPLLPLQLVSLLVFQVISISLAYILFQCIQRMEISEEEDSLIRKIF